MARLGPAWLALLGWQAAALQRTARERLDAGTTVAAPVAGGAERAFRVPAGLPRRAQPGAMTRPCLGGCRLGELRELRAQIAAWSADVNARQRGVEWRMKIDDARCKLKSVYTEIILCRNTRGEATA